MCQSLFPALGVPPGCGLLGNDQEIALLDIIGNKKWTPTRADFKVFLRVFRVNPRPKMALPNYQ